MAFVFKNVNSKFWIAGFCDINRKRRNRSTKLLAIEANKRKAQKIADAYEEAGNRKRASQQVRQTISDLHKELTGEDLPVATVSKHIEKWLSSKATSISERTKRFYQDAAKKFQVFLGTRAEMELTDVTRDDIEDFRDELALKLAPKTTNHNIKVLKMIFRDARDRTLIVYDPTEFVKPVKEASSEKRRPFSMEQIRSIMLHCDEEWKSMLLFGLYTGQRLGDIAKLRWDSVNLERATLILITAKTNKRLNLPMHPDLIDNLRSLPAPIDQSLPIHTRAASILKEHGRSSQLSNEFGRILAAAGIREKRPHRPLGEGRDGKRTMNELSFHSLRRTASTLLHEAGVPQSVAMALIGHDSKDIHAIYVSVGESAMREAASKLPSIAG